MKYFIVDAFTSEPFGGNPAGVVLLQSDSFPAESLMQQVAAELRYSETVFVQRNGDAQFSSRYFTPQGEVDLCGHATIATFGLLRQLDEIAPGTQCINHTLAGNLKVITGEQVMMQMATPQVIDKAIDTQQLHSIMGCDPCWELPQLPVEIVSTGLPDIMMPVGSVDQLNALTPDMDALADMSKELGVTGVHAFTLSNDGFTAHVRNFGPLYGIPEESATGTANAALTHYLQRHGIINCGAECRFMQGEAMQRPSVVCTSLHNDGSIWVGGKVCVIASGNLMV